MVNILWPDFIHSFIKPTGVYLCTFKWLITDALREFYEQLFKHLTTPTTAYSEHIRV